jgi:hypothetical protein
VDTKGQVSPDGRWFWNGKTWITTLSPDGRWRWNGASWAASNSAPTPNRNGRGVWWIPGFRTGKVWKLPVVAVGFLLLLGGINSVVSQPPSTSTGQGVAQASPSTSVSTSSKSQSPASAAAAAKPSASPSPSPSPSPAPKPSPSPVPTRVAPPPPPPPTTCGAPANPWGYNFCSGDLIYSPPSTFCSYFPCIASFWKSTNGYVDECNDGKYSHSGGRQGACSYHGGEMRPLYS